MDTKVYRPAGYKYPTVSALGKDWTQFGLDGTATYDEIIYALSGILTAGVVTTPDAVNAPTARQWDFAPATVNADAPKRYTIEQGSADRAHRASFGQFTELTMDLSREEVKVGGSMMARALQDGITMTPTPTALPLIPVLGSQVSIYMDPTSAALGTTKLARSLSANLKISGRFGPLWFLDAAQTSFTDVVETEPEVTLEITPEADAAGMAIFANLRANARRFVRVEAVGAALGGTTSYRLRFDMAMDTVGVGEFSDEDGLYVLPFTLRAMHDAGYGKAFTARVVNAMAAL